ncbi:MAG: reverse transcriptase family protein [Lentisphaeraceae bacterium]|nr:reverse transcriptase family protein [Lentisphaeraceae bacterium]
MSWADNRNSFIRKLAKAIYTCPWNNSEVINLLIELSEEEEEWIYLFSRQLLIEFPEKPYFYQLYKFINKYRARKYLFKFNLIDQYEIPDEAWEELEEDEKGLYQENLPEFYISEMPVDITYSSPIKSVKELCSLLDLRVEELEFLSDYENREVKRKEQKLLNYFYKWIPKRNGKRLIEHPKPLLKECQKRLNKILHTYPVHSAACAYVKGKSIVDFAKPHCGKKVVLKMDIENFFPSIRAYSVREFFLQNDFPYTTALFLTGLCSNVPPSKFTQQEKIYSNPHLPQGAPTSSTLSNLCFAEIDRRLEKAAKKTGLTYTRYADDLAFSSDSSVNITSFRNTVTRILHEGNFKINHRKTRVNYQGQRQSLCNITVNEKVNTSRVEYDKLKATIHNCIIHGSESQNRENHPHFKLSLIGKIYHVKMVNNDRGQKLLDKFNEILWS